MPYVCWRWSHVCPRWSVCDGWLLRKSPIGVGRVATPVRMTLSRWLPCTGPMLLIRSCQLRPAIIVAPKALLGCPRGRPFPSTCLTLVRVCMVVLVGVTLGPVRHHSKVDRKPEAVAIYVTCAILGPVRHLAQADCKAGLAAICVTCFIWFVDRNGKDHQYVKVEDKNKYFGVD